MTEQIEIEESKSQSVQSDDDSGSDLGDGDVVEKVERPIYQPIEFDLNDPSNTFVIDFVSLQPDQQKPSTAANTVPVVPESGAVPSEAASEGPKKKEPNPALFSNRMTSVIQRIESIYATAADLGYDSNDSFIDDDELFDEENDAAAEEEALYQGFYINKGELETKKRSREEPEESEEPAKKKRRVDSGDTNNNTTTSPHKKSEDKTKKKKKKKSTGSTPATAEVTVKSDGAKKKKKSGAGDKETDGKKKDTADRKSKKGDKSKTADSAAQLKIKTSPLLEEHIAQLSAAARQFVERHLAEQQQQPPTAGTAPTATATAAPTAAASPTTAPAKDGNKVVRFPRRLEPKLLLVAQDLQGLYPQLTFPDTLIQRIAAPFAPVFKAESVRQRMLRLLQQHKPEQIDERTELGQLLKIRQFLLKQFHERLQTMCDKLKRTVLPGEPQPRWTWSEDFKRKVGEIIELEKVIITLRASESEGKKEPGKESKPVDMNKALKPVYSELSAMWPEGWITNQRIATAVKPRSNDALPTAQQVIAHYTPYLTGEKSDEVHPRPAVLASAKSPSTNTSTANTNNPVAQVRSVPTPMPQTTQYAATQASVQGLPSGVSFNQLTGLGWSPSSPMPNAAFPPYGYPPQMYNNNGGKPGEYTYYTPQ